MPDCLRHMTRSLELAAGEGQPGGSGEGEREDWKVWGRIGEVKLGAERGLTDDGGTFWEGVRKVALRLER